MFCRKTQNAIKHASNTLIVGLKAHTQGVGIVISPCLYGLKITRTHTRHLESAENIFMSAAINLSGLKDC